MTRPTLAIDFDGVVHRYSQGWQGGVIYDPPTDGTRDALIQLNKRFDLVLFTARHNLAAVHEWLYYYGLRHLFKDVTNRKPMAVAYLDDRAVRFESWDQAVKELMT